MVIAIAIGLALSATVAAADPPPPPPPPTTGGGGGGGGTGGGGSGGGTTTSTPPPKHKVNPPPNPVTDLRVNNRQNGHLVISWTLPTASDLNKVFVMRTQLPSCSSGIHDGTLIGGTNLRSSQIDSSVVVATKYCYTVFVSDRAGHVSAADDTGFVALPDRTPPSPVTSVVATSSGSTVLVTWKAPLGAASHYLVMRGPAGACPRRPNKALAVADSKTTSFTDTNVQSGDQYCYVVFPVDKAGNVQRSAATSAAITLSSGTTTTSTSPKPAPKPQPVSHTSTSNGPLSSAIARMVAAVGVAVLVFGLIVLMGLRLQGGRPGARRAPPAYPVRSRNGAVMRLHLGDYDTRALVIPAVLGLGLVLLLFAIAALTI